MIKLIKKFQTKVIPFDAIKNWNINNINNEDVILLESDNEEPVALEFIDYGDIGDVPTINDSCDIALEQQEDDLVKTNVGLKKSDLFFPNSEPINDTGIYKRMIHAQINTMFYNNQKNPTQIWGTEKIDFELSETKKKLSDSFRLLDVPKTIYGDKIIPNTVVINNFSINDDFTITDDGCGNLVAGPNLFSKHQTVGEFVNTFTTGNDQQCDSYWDYIY